MMIPRSFLLSTALLATILPAVGQSTFHHEIIQESTLTDIPGKDSSLAIAADGTMHLAYRVEFNGLTESGESIYYRSKSAAGWSSPQLIEYQKDGYLRWPRIALMPDGSPRIAYYAEYDIYDGAFFAGDFSGIRFAAPVLLGWESQTIESRNAGGQLGEYPALCIGTDGIPRVSYWDRTGNECRYAVQDTNGWNPETFATEFTFGRSMGSFTSIAINPDASRVAVAFHDEAVQGLKVRIRNLSNPQITDTVLNIGPTITPASQTFGQQNSIAFDREGRLHLAFHDPLLGDLHIHRHSGSPPLRPHLIGNHQRSRIPSRLCQCRGQSLARLLRDQPGIPAHQAGCRGRQSSPPSNSSLPAPRRPLKWANSAASRSTPGASHT